MALLIASPAAMAQAAGCAPAGTWIDPATRGEVAPPFDEAAEAAVVLLGEQHDKVSHHRFELDAVTALLFQRRPGMVIGFEMFPRAKQPMLDRWIQGKLGEDAFLAALDWSRIWGFPSELYMPLFRFARDHHIPMVALDVPARVVRQVAQSGLAAVPMSARAGVGQPAAALPAYRDALVEAMRDHAGSRLEPFIDAQLFRDRAMAEALTAAGERTGNPLVVGIMGLGHLEHGWGVPHQLAALDVGPVTTLLPWDVADGCDDLPGDYADAVFLAGG